MFDSRTDNRRLLTRYWILLEHVFGEDIHVRFVAAFSKEDSCKTLSVMHTESSLQEMKTSTQRSLLEMKANTETSLEQIKELLLTLSPQRAMITGVALIDATGRRYEVPIDLAKSYEVWSSNYMRIRFDLGIDVHEYYGTTLQKKYYGSSNCTTVYAPKKV